MRGPQLCLRLLNVIHRKSLRDRYPGGNLRHPLDRNYARIEQFCHGRACTWHVSGYCRHRRFGKCSSDQSVRKTGRGIGFTLIRHRILRVLILPERYQTFTASPGVVP